MEWAHGANITAIQIYNDSQLVINQVQGTYAVHSEGLRPYADSVRRWKEKFSHFTISLDSRKDNQQADRREKIASRDTRNEEGIPIEEFSKPEETSLIQSLQPA